MRALQPEPERELVGLDIEVIHAQSWGEYDTRLLFGAAMQVGEDGPMQYLNPRSWAKVVEEFFVQLREGGEFIVVGHNISFDLGGINGWLMRYGAKPMPPLRVSDTYRHTYRHNGMYSKNLANTARQLGIPFPKGHVERWDWDEATMWDDSQSLKLIREYNENDVRLLFPIRRKLIELGHLRTEFEWWRP